MRKGKKLIPLIIGVALLLMTVVPSSIGYAEGTINSVFKNGKLNIEDLSSEAKVEKIDKKDLVKNFKTTIKEDKAKNKKLIGKEDADKKARDVLINYSKIDISKNTPVKTEETVDGIFETVVGGNEEGKSKVSIDKYGRILSIHTPKNKPNVSKNYEINVDKSKSLVNDFLNNYEKENINNINVVLTNNNSSSDGTLNYKLQRVYKEVEVCEEGGSITVDGESIKITSFNMKWSSMDFEEEKGNKLTKKEAIKILDESDELKPFYISNGQSYILDFTLSKGEEYVIDVNQRKIKDVFQDEYIVKKNVSKGIENLTDSKKTKSEVEEISIEIINRLTGKKGKSLPVNTIEENGRKLIRNVIAVENGEKYYVEYDAKTFKVVNIYKYGYDTKETSNFKPLEFEEAYKKAVTAAGLIYNEELKELNLKQKAYDLSNSRVYNFIFNRNVNEIDVKDQYVSVSIDAITGEVLSVFLEWDSKLKFDDSGKKQFNEKRNSYLNSLKGSYIYINENGIGKLYYTLKDK